jgi:two-component system alkaline phosphatase synthesis response regulator PhoP
VLLVDDDTVLLRLLRLWLEDSGFEVLTASNGEDALKQLDTGTPAAVVLDMEMPVMDGRTCFRQMRARGIDAPVLILSAHDAKDAQRELHAEASMSKPFDPDDLTDRILDLVGNHA